MVSQQIREMAITDPCKGTAYPGIWEMASRNNPKRGFLFVNRLLGKHIPTYWGDLCMTGIALARKAAGCSIIQMEGYILHPHLDTTDRWQVMQDGFIEQYTQASPVSLGNKVGVIGMAETATGLGYTVSLAIENAVFTKSTRSDKYDSAEGLEFQEPHCHAPAHKLLTEGLHGCDTVVIVDDEVTTGTTVLNLVKLLRENFPEIHKTYFLSILNWMDDKSFKEFDHQGIEIVYLERGTLKLAEGDVPPVTGKIDPESIKPDTEFERFGEVREFEESYTDIMWNTTSTLVLGGGEFIPEAFELARSLELCFMTSTRSPIIPEKSGIIHSAVEYTNPVSEVSMYLYNMDTKFTTLIFQESPDMKWAWLSEEVKTMLRRNFYKGIFIVKYPEEV